MFVAGWNMPGYLPDSTPEEFETLEDAWTFVADTIAMFWEEDLFGIDDGVPTVAIDRQWQPLLGKARDRITSAETGAIGPVDDLVFWVEKGGE